MTNKFSFHEKEGFLFFLLYIVFNVCTCFTWFYVEFLKLSDPFDSKISPFLCKDFYSLSLHTLPSGVYLVSIYVNCGNILEVGNLRCVWEKLPQYIPSGTCFIDFLFFWFILNKIFLHSRECLSNNRVFTYLPGFMFFFFFDLKDVQIVEIFEVYFHF